MEMPRSLDWINRLVSADTVTRNPNRPVIDLIAAEAERLGLPHHVLPHASQSGKANLVVTVPAKDGTTTGGVVLSGHSDVVPIDGQDWHSGPFEPEVRDGRYYGRGACDMKGFIGIAVDRLADMKAAELTEPIHLAITYDEEIGCLGGEVIVKEIADLGISPRIAFVGEPSTMHVVRAHKSINSLHLTFHGIAAHSSLTTQAVNAVEYAASYITKVREQADKWRTEGPFDEAYLIPHTTTSCNVINGGIAGNTVADKCEVLMEFRSIAADGDRAALIERFRAVAAEVESRMQAENPEARVDFEIRASVPGLDSDADSPAALLGAELGGIPTDNKVTYATEAGQFSESGIETVVLGPGDIAQAHTANEYVEIDQLLACEQFVDNLIAHLSR